MLVTVEGLDHLSGGDYYTLFMTRKGKPVATCGTSTSAEGRHDVRFSVAYDSRPFDGLMLAEYTAREPRTSLSVPGVATT